MPDPTPGSLSRPVTIQHVSPTELLKGTAPLPYTINPWALFLSDMALFVRQAWYLPTIVWPLKPCKSGALDELYPSPTNLFDILLHVGLTVAQIAFLISIPLSLFSPIPFNMVVLYVAGFVGMNALLCKVLLNGLKSTLVSKADISHFPNTHDDERWIFLNGVAVGQHWLQSNIDRLSLTFGRKVLGVHNPTVGIIFDVIECLLQRDFAYVTDDIRNCYAVLKGALNDAKCKKVVFICHSQGGIEGGLVLDWLYAEVSRELLEKLEVYTFGNAANHFNNPYNVTKSKETDDATTEPVYSRTIKHIEHYANHGDFVSRWGVLHFASGVTKRGRNNCYAGRVFERQGKGHQFNQHYLDTMFPLTNGPDGWRACEDNPFMNSDVQFLESPQGTNAPLEDLDKVDNDTKNTIKKVAVRNLTLPSDQESVSLLSHAPQLSTEKVSDYSRLWSYRNGMSPKD